jgi:hypothetical protein
VFYRDKFEQIGEVLNESITQGDKKSKIQAKIQAILRDQFKIQGISPAPSVTPIPRNVPELKNTASLGNKSSETFGESKK